MEAEGEAVPVTSSLWGLRSGRPGSQPPLASALGTVAGDPWTCGLSSEEAAGAGLRRDRVKRRVERGHCGAWPCPQLSSRRRGSGSSPVSAALHLMTESRPQRTPVTCCHGSFNRREAARARDLGEAPAP